MQCSFLFILIITVFVLPSFLSAHNCSAAVSRQIELDMDDVTRFQLVKTRTYSNDEVGVIRTQLDSQFGNGDGILDDNEVNSFLASYNDYFEDTTWIVMDESTVIKQNASVITFNLAGDTSDWTNNITTVFTFDARPVSIPQQREYFIKFNRELWKYNDLNGIARNTVDNNLTISAPQGWRIVYTAGLHNETYEDDSRVMSSNANLNFEWINVKISTDVEANGDGDDEPLSSENMRYIAIIIVILAVIVTLILVKAYYPKKTQTPAEPITETEREELLSEKKKVQEEIISVRRELRDNTITKDEAKVRERALKERLTEIEGMLSVKKITK